MRERTVWRVFNNDGNHELRWFENTRKSLQNLRGSMHASVLNTENFDLTYTKGYCDMAETNAMSKEEEKAALVAKRKEDRQKDRRSERQEERKAQRIAERKPAAK